MTCVDWQGADKAPQADEIFQMQSRLQKYGFKQRCEVITIFGVSQVGLFGFDDDKFRRRLWRDTVVQNSAFALIDTSPCFFSNKYPFTADHVSPSAYFWLAGHRAVPIIGARPWSKPSDPEHEAPNLPGGEIAEEYARVNRLYHLVLPRMQRLRVTDGGKYALWLNAQNQPSVLWCFADCSISITGEVITVETGSKQQVDPGFQAKAGQVYLVQTT